MNRVVVSTSGVMDTTNKAPIRWGTAPTSRGLNSTRDRQTGSQHLIHEDASLLSKQATPYQSIDNGRICFYRVNQRDRGVVYVLTVDGFEIGPIRIIQESRYDRGIYYILLQPDTVKLPATAFMTRRISFGRKKKIWSSSCDEHILFVSEDMGAEEMRTCLIQQYPQHRQGIIHWSEPVTYLMIEESQRT